MKYEDSKKIDKLTLISKTSEYMISESHGVNKNKEYKEKEKNIHNFNPNYMGSCKSKSINMIEFCNDMENFKFDNLSTYIIDETDNISNFNKKLCNNKFVDSNFNYCIKKSNNKDEEEFELNCIEKNNVENNKFKDINEMKISNNLNYLNKANSNKLASKFSVKHIERSNKNVNTSKNGENVNNKSEFSKKESCKSSSMRCKFNRLTGEMLYQFRVKLKKLVEEKGDIKAKLILNLLKCCNITKESLYSKHGNNSILFFLNSNFLEFLSNVITILLLKESKSNENSKITYGLKQLLILILEYENELSPFNKKLDSSTNIDDINIGEFKTEIENQINLRTYNLKESYLNEEGINLLESIKKEVYQKHKEDSHLGLIEMCKRNSVSESTNEGSKSVNEADFYICQNYTNNDSIIFKKDKELNFMARDFDESSLLSYQKNEKLFISFFDIDCND